MRMVFLYTTAFLASTLTLSACVKAGSQDVGSCSDFVAEVRKRVDSGGISVAEGISATRQRERDCMGTGVYEASLSDLYISAGDFLQARKYIGLGLKVPEVDKTIFYESLFEINANEGLDSKNKILGEELVSSGDISLGHLVLGKYYGRKGDVAESVKSLEIASESPVAEVSYASNRNLVAVYWAMKDYKGVARAFDKADVYSGDYIYSDPGEPKIAAISNLLIGNVPRSKEILTKLLQTHPGIANDEYVRMLQKDLSEPLSANGAGE